MSNDWSAFREKLEEEGVLFVDEDTHVLPRVRERNMRRWGHIRRILMMVQKKEPDLYATEELDIEQVFEGLLRVTKKTKSVLFSIDELLDLLHDIDQEEGDFDFKNGSTSDYVKRIKEAFSKGKEEYVWRKGQTPEESIPSFRIGAPPPIPRKPSE
tara:strand:+ start:152 stop:619 length:468 start_codon:yes stop_codon:yes gene_type:complete